MDSNKIIEKYGKTETGKYLRSLLEKIEDGSYLIPHVLLITKTDENMKKLIKALENGATDKDEILYRAICIKQGEEYDPIFLDGLDTELSV